MGLSGLAAETLSVLDAGGYTSPSGRWVDLRDALAKAVRNTRLVRPAEAEALAARTWTGTHSTSIEVTDEGTADAGRRLAAAGQRVAVLNFASARNVGGGFLGGARAQEEELCRASGLYRCLETQRGYYDANRAERSALYTDHAIESPDVPFFRDASRAFVEEPWLLTVLTSPAPNTGALLQQDDAESLARIEAAFRRRAAQVLALAREGGHDVLVLGAWGCGAFQGDPEMVSAIFRELLDGPFSGSFERVVFAVLVKSRRDARNLEAFRRLERRSHPALRSR
ncbi:MAG TPA: TIGR02452 family protein [bacterium]|nr:TIGR02452 family protein [bacterium]